MKNSIATNFIDFIHRSPSCYHATENFRSILLGHGYTELLESEKWEMQYGGKYFVTRNDSSILAFRIPNVAPTAFAMAAAHSDAPTFKVKENP